MPDDAYLSEKFLDFLQGIAASDREINDMILEGLGSSPVSFVHVPPEDLDVPRDLLKPNMCHLNADTVSSIVGGDVVRGWMIFEKGLILHSVNEVSGKMLCLTPHGIERGFLFIPDGRVFVRDDGGRDFVLIDLGPGRSAETPPQKVFMNHEEALRKATSYLNSSSPTKMDHAMENSALEDIIGRLKL